MKELKGKVRGLIDGYFDEKIRDVNWYNDLNAKFDVIDIISTCLRKTCEAINDCNESIDAYLEDFEEQHWRDREEEKKLVLDDMRTQDEMEADLWS